MAVVLIDALPKYISAEEHRNLVASTPASFSDIPPVLRHKEDNVSITLDPPLDTFSAEDAANGSLYVIERYAKTVDQTSELHSSLFSHLVFMSTTGRGFQVEYPRITLHAISRGEKGPSIYCQLDDTVDANTNAEPQNDEEEVSDMRELSILPKDPSARKFNLAPHFLGDALTLLNDLVEPIFEALSYCASLHPDPGADDEMDDDDDAFVNAEEFETFNGDHDQELSEVGRVRSDFLNNSRFAPY